MSIACIVLIGIRVAKVSSSIKSNGATQKILLTHCFTKLTILQSTVEDSHNFPSKIPYLSQVTYDLAHYIWPPLLLNGGHNWTEYDPITQHPSYWSHMQTCCDYIATSTWQFFVNFLLSFIVCCTAWTITKIQNCETEISDGRCTAADSNLCPISNWVGWWCVVWTSTLSNILFVLLYNFLNGYSQKRASENALQISISGGLNLSH